MKRCLVTGQVVTYPSRPVPHGMGCKPMPLAQAVCIRDRYRMAETPPRSGSERQGAWGAVRLEPGLLVVRHEQGCLLGNDT